MFVSEHNSVVFLIPGDEGHHDAPKYNGTNGDILNFAIYAKSDSSVLRMFSLSRIHGALGDNGQNFKSLQLGVTIFEALYLTSCLKYLKYLALASTCASNVAIYICGWGWTKSGSKWIILLRSFVAKKLFNGDIKIKYGCGATSHVMMV